MKDSLASWPAFALVALVAAVVGVALVELAVL